MCFQFRLHLGDAHRVHLDDWQVATFLAELEKHQAAVGLERLAQPPHEQLRGGELGVDVQTNIFRSSRTALATTSAN